MFDVLWIIFGGTAFITPTSYSIIAELSDIRDGKKGHD